jgi:hypothetical protein
MIRTGPYSVSLLSDKLVSLLALLDRFDLWFEISAP